ncbi:GspE/PulE family protein [Candidatus Vampirococcus lugosii]|uniref:Type II secretion system protein E n=1 Tax=Candidatus Vampirococcus lugosii TaxID=2789015 RepID=A0ABS5QJK2_9BACT|nr:Type II secretion system protein E [Candidatus Vampirococcus lugosii]
MKNNLSKKILDLSDVKKINPDNDKLKILSYSIAEKAQAIIFDGDSKKLHILTTNNYPSILTQILDKIAVKGYKFEFFYVDEVSFAFAMNWYDNLYKEEKKAEDLLKQRKTVRGKYAIDVLKKLYEEKSKYSEQEFITELIRLSFQSNASDLHFQPEESGIVLRLRRDGILKTILVFEYQEFKKYLVKLKFMAGVRLNISKTPQDGRFDFVSYNKDETTKKIDVRVSFMPGLRGESIVMRFLDSTNSVLGFGDIGFMGETLNVLSRNLKKKHGMILVTGPTGSGKTTTLYSMLNYLNTPSKKIITLEDPVEYELPGIQQSQISAKNGYNYEDGLKAVLRQDPEIIMVGEIRNLETAEIAINAALTGHLVISTLHTNSAIETISRLLSMGVKPYMLAPALNLVIGQRLLRKLHTCKNNRKAKLAEEEDIKQNLKSMKDINKNIKETFDGYVPLPSGCEKCGSDGFMGRIAIVETFELNDNIKNTILNDKPDIYMYSEARQSGFLTMKEDAYIKMLNGLTTLDEIRRVV